MKNIILFFGIFLFLFSSCTTYNEAEDNISVTVLVADINQILSKLDENEAKNLARFNELNTKLMLLQGDISAMKESQLVIANTLAGNNLLLQQYQNYFLQLITLGTLTQENTKINLEILGQVQVLLLQIAFTQESHSGLLNSLKNQLLQNYLIMLDIASDLKDVKNWTLQNQGQLNQLVALFGGLENMTNAILSTLISQGILQAQMFEKLQALTLQMSVLQASLETWGSLIVSKIDQLGLTLQQQGITLANILGNTRNLPFFTAQVLAKLDALQLSVNEIKSLQLATIDHLYEIKGQIANLQEVVNSIFAQVLLLQEGQLDILIAINSKLCGGNTNIVNSYNYVFNEYLTNITNISQIYNACSNGLNGCSGGVVPASNVCMMLNVMNPFIVGNNNNTNYNFGNLYNIGYGNTNSISNNFGC